MRLLPQDGVRSIRHHNKLAIAKLATAKSQVDLNIMSSLYLQKYIAKREKDSEVMRSVSIMERKPVNEVKHVDIPNFSLRKAKPE